MGTRFSAAPGVSQSPARRQAQGARDVEILVRAHHHIIDARGDSLDAAGIFAVSMQKVSQNCLLMQNHQGSEAVTDFQAPIQG